MKNIHGIEVKLAEEQTAKVISESFNGFYIQRREVCRDTNTGKPTYRYDVCHKNTVVDYNYFTFEQALIAMHNYYVRQTVERPLNF